MDNDKLDNDKLDNYWSNEAVAHRKYVKQLVGSALGININTGGICGWRYGETGISNGMGGRWIRPTTNY